MKQPKESDYIPLPNEIWRKVPRFPLEASDLGRIRHKQTKRILVITSGEGYEYPRVSFTKRSGKIVTAEVHRLVASAHFGPVPKHWDVDHTSDDKSDNRLSNLQVMPHQQNIEKALVAGRLRSKLTPEQIPVIRKLVAVGVPIAAVADTFDVKPATINNIIKGRSWSAISSAE